MVAGAVTTTLNVANHPTSVARISGTKIKITAIQAVIRPTVDKPANGPTRTLSEGIFGPVCR